MSEEVKERQPAGEVEEKVTQQAPSGSGVSEPVKEEPEFFIDADGQLKANLKDWNFEEETQAGEKEPDMVEAKEEPENEPKEKEEPQRYYTPEEIARLELYEIDPERIPPQLKPYYEALLKEAQAREKEKKAQQPAFDENAVADFIQAEAIKRVELKTGEKFDELNPRHIALLAYESAQLASEIKTRMQYQKRVQELASSEPYFAQIDRYAQEKIYELPAKEFLKIQKAIQEGDYDVIFNFWEACRREFYEKKLGKAPQGAEAKAKQPQPAPEPPKVEGAGKGEVATKPKITPKDFARMTDDEKAQALIELGLI